MASSDRYLVYASYPPGTDFCQGGEEGDVIVRDLETGGELAIDTVRAACLCCGRLSIPEELQVSGDYVLVIAEREDFVPQARLYRIGRSCR